MTRLSTKGAYKYLPSTVIICCCSRKIALWRYPPKAVLPLTCCPWFEDCLRFLTFRSPIVCPRVVSASSRIFILIFSFVAAWIVFRFAISAVVFCDSSGFPFWGQLHCAFGEARKKTCTRQAIETEMAIKLMPVAKAAPPNLSLSEPAILLKCVNRFLNKSLFKTTLRPQSSLLSRSTWSRAELKARFVLF